MNTFDPPQRQRPKSSILESFMHRRQASNGDNLPSRPFDGSYAFSSNDDAAAASYSKNNPGALGELQQNQQEPAPRFPRRDDYNNNDDPRGRSRSPTKNMFGNMTVITSVATKDASKVPKTRDVSPKKPKKTKSGGNLAGLFKPKSLRNLHKLMSDEDMRLSKDKENRKPDDTTQTPIWAQFTSDFVFQQKPNIRASIDMSRNNSDTDLYASSRQFKERPKSFQVPIHTKTDPPPSPSRFKFPQDLQRKGSKDSSNSKSSSRSVKPKGYNPLATFAHNRSKSTSVVAAPEQNEPVLDPKDVDKHLEAMLDRRNIPENQRYKMRNLNATIKMEFVRQDWAEMAAARGDRPPSMGSVGSADGATMTASTPVEEKPKRSRGKSFTLSLGKKDKDKEKDSGASAKKGKGDGTVGRHFRSKSTDSIASDAGGLNSGPSTPTSGIFSKIKLQQGPADYVAYLRKVQKPELVEVGKIHKLRLLLRNETVAWIEDFIQQGGMNEIVSLLNRIMEVEWREEHEDALLHEVLLCLKALSTTARAMQYLHSIQSELFPKLIHMIFDPEKKGPSEFTTRNIITSVMFRYIESASPAERVFRAKSILAHLRDPEPKEDERPVPFVLEMRRDRPYRVWCKEVVNVTKEVFWIFLHNINVISLQTEKTNDTKDASFPGDNRPYAYMMRHFPQERPPVAAAPYVGGVEWEATNYLASHLDLMNAILACAATKEERNNLRHEFNISGWERCLGGSLRLCKEKFYGSVHTGLRTWVAAAHEDGWDVRDVRYGPPPESRNSPKKVAGGGQKPKVEPAPKIEMPKLDFGPEKPKSTPKDDEWL